MNIKFYIHNLSNYGKLTLQGIHLKDPDLYEFEDAIAVADRDGFNKIHIYKTKASFKKYFQLITGSAPWPESNIVRFRSIVGGYGQRTTLTEDEIKILFWLFDHCGPYKITKEQTNKGKEYLYNFCFNKKGELRKHKNIDVFAYNYDIIKNISHFEFVGLYDISGNRCPQYLPIYRTHSKDGRYFDYIPGITWGIPEVI